MSQRTIIVVVVIVIVIVVTSFSARTTLQTRSCHLKPRSCQLKRKTNMWELLRFLVGNGKSQILIQSLIIVFNTTN